MADRQFDLLTEPWIRVRMLDDQVQDVSLRDLFHRAHEIAGLAGESATQDNAMLRTLLAVLIRAVRTTDLVDQSSSVIWDQLRTMPDLGEFVGEYLDTVADRFRLFGDKAPFYQVADLHTKKGEYSSVGVLIPDIGPGLFSTRTAEDAQSLQPAEAARWLVREQAYSLSGIKSGAEGDPRVKGGKGYPIGTGWAGALGSVQVLGPTLRDTLVLCLPLSAFSTDERELEQDLPPWERQPDTSAPRALEEVDPRGVVDLLTWQQRRIRLWADAQGAATKVLIANGDRLRLINQFTEPLSGFRYSQAQSKKGVSVYFAKSHDPDLTVWRGVQALFLESGASAEAAAKSDRPAPVIDQLRTDPVLGDLVQNAYGADPLGLRLVGAEYGTQSAVLTGEIEEVLSMHPVVLGRHGGDLRQAALDAVGMVMSFRGSLNWFIKQLEVCAGGSGDTASPAGVQSWLSELEGAFTRWLAGLRPDSDAAEAGRTWRTTMYVVTVRHIESGVEAAGPRAAIGWMEVGESGRGQLHSSARYEAWAKRKLTQATGVRLSKPSQPVTADTESHHESEGER
ncbi:type I-E CRISPR-associated protein Cse1/CasA [Kocuria sp.]|uniref:type I-E CRISPR-associated protein Cse1/CasA n=1 Tax=Kocuria sp. TaxID=1871328 RepID=UPI0026DF6AD7|nr:type I-E CRISPR-associated protein Cse1/CasA [Kocuria sp.]MDO5617954.1 type I-E CRISPR-associated protein Cse1/CasA [Kocuria sp.]